MGIKHTIKKEEASYFLTLTVIEWIDVFTREIYSKILLESLKYCIKNKGLNINGYVIMSNHIHLLVNSENGYSLSSTIRDLKRHSSKQIILNIMEGKESRKEWMLERFKKAGLEHSKKINYKFWQDGNHAIEVYSEKFT